MKEFCNVAHPTSSSRNALPDLLRRWFGLAAGHPGTAFHVRFSRSPDGLWVEPERTEDVATAPRRALLAFPTLRAAAGAASAPTEISPAIEPGTVLLPTSARGDGLFAVRAEGDSMDGGKRPIRDGDWLIMRFARGTSPEALDGKVALLEVQGRDSGFGYQIKRVVRDGAQWKLRSDNPARPSFEVTASTVPLAILVGIIPPEALGPSVGERLDDAEVARAFGLEAPPRSGRVEGHLFICIEMGSLSALVAPDRACFPLDKRRPGETAFVLTRPPGETPWRYWGVGRYHESDDLWAFPGVDFATYRALGGRGASRSLPTSARERAQALVEELLRRPGAGAILERSGRRCRIVGPAAGGGLRIDGGPGGFAERTVSLIDLGWVLVARDDARGSDAILDEPRVNRLRYLEGTPKASTRWIDTPWALLLMAAADGAGTD